jgi:hypothetical protein
MHGEKRNSYRILAVKIGGKRPLGRHRYRWKESAKTNLGQVGSYGLD